MNSPEGHARGAGAVAVASTATIYKAVCPFRALILNSEVKRK